ncbi:uncharacterized protein LOC132746875 [Ruditapes philippinarum]|uniref:uncharacterized protein LOC132746875 n=1 Tax=Ruditapes philippinarum TaxID=129788 RepID=UPI00295B0451|nr:uncharacterized protein LOC132746875 [Ruditapes philippinarum]
MERGRHENYTRIISLLMEGGTFIARELLKRETKKKEGNLKDFLKDHAEQLKRRFTQEQMNDIGLAFTEDWNVVLLTGVILELFRTTLTPREKRELLVIRNVREELLAHVEDVSLDEETFEDLRDQLEEALDTLSQGLDSALVVKCQEIVSRYVDEPIHMPSTLDRLHEMCEADDAFENVAQRLKEETKSIVDDIIGIVRKAEDNGREMKEPKVIEFVIQPHSRNKELLESVETALDDVSEHFTSTEEDGQSEFHKVKKALEEIFEEVKTICKVFAKYEKGKGAIFRIECKSYRILLDVIGYFESLQCLERLEVVASVLRKHFGTENRLSLTCNFDDENMKSLFEAIKTENIEYSRSIRLSMRVNDLQGLVNIWDVFNGGGAQNQFNQIAELLSEYVGSKISITASVDVPKFKEALEEAIKQTSPGIEDQNINQEDEQETNHGTQESGDKVEDTSNAANTERATVPRRGGVEIVAVQPGTRKTTLFDETISEGVRDEITEMGFDTRDIRQSGDDIESSRVEEIEEIVAGANIDKTEAEKQLEEPNLEGYKTKEANEKPQGLVEEIPLSDNVTANLARNVSPITAETDVTQNIPSEMIHVTDCAIADNFYSNIMCMTSRFGESSDSAQNRTHLDSTLCTTVPVSEGEPSEPAQQDKLVSRMKYEFEHSVLLSTVLEKFGLNQEVFESQQEMIQISESIMNQMAKLSKRRVNVIHFGSEAEGTKVKCEHLDTMVILDEYTVIQNAFSLEQPSTIRTIILAENTRPGFMHLPLTDEMFKDISDESSLICAAESLNRRKESTANVHCGFGAATVFALRMPSWPIELKRSLQQRAIAWAFDTSGEHLLSKPLLMVPHDSTDYRDEKMEWRVSTAYVERFLMNSLNIHQKRVFFLFRTIIRNFLNPHISGSLTSYMIKNIFFHMVSNTWPDLWNTATLIICLVGCLTKTRQFLRADFLPHFFILKENLIAGALNPEDRCRADEILLRICSNPYESISSITEGNLLNINAEGSEKQTQIPANRGERKQMHLLINYESCAQIAVYKDFLLEWIVKRSSNETSAVENHYRILNFLETHISGIEHVTNSLVANVAYQYISTSLASHLVCLALKTENTVERDWYLCAATIYFQRGMQSDALSSKMKFITSLIALNHLTSARKMMLEIEISDRMNSQAVCPCILLHSSGVGHNSPRMSRKGKIMEHVCTCVTFLHTESLITPLAMRYEMYRSATASFVTNANSMPPYRKWAAVDAKVYFGFLNTVLYSTIEYIGVYLGSPDVYHMEIVLNFLGLWSEYIEDYSLAAAYYKESLRHIPAQNAAQWYICLLLFKQWIKIHPARTTVN